MNWPPIAHAVLEANDGRDKYLFFHPNLLGRLSREDERETSDKPGAPYRITIKIISDLAELNQQAKTDEARALLDQVRARYGMINLSSLRRQVEANLIHTSPRFADDKIGGSTAFRIARSRRHLPRKQAARFPRRPISNVA